jgi:hypothetical protein
MRYYNENTWYIHKSIEQLTEEDKEKQFKRYIKSLCDKIINNSYAHKVLSVQQYEEKDGFMYIRFIDINDGVGTVRVPINEFWKYEEEPNIKQEYFGRFNCHYIF